MNMSEFGSNLRRVPVWVWIVAALVAGLILGSGGGGAGRDGHEGPEMAQAETGAQEKATVWTCSMHPQIRQPKPGKCPICGMELIPVGGGSGDDSLGPRQIRLSESARTLSEIRTAPVQRNDLPVQVDLLGRVVYDETRQRDITAWVGGRLDRLYVDFTGVRVNKGQAMASLYSPELYSAQEELFQALDGEKKFEKSSLESIRGTAGLTVEAAKRKLNLLGLSADLIQSIIENGKPETHLTITSPASGTVVSKDALEGQYVETGSRIYTVVDLSRVWVLLQAYESDLSWVSLGREVSFTVEAFPGETFSGKVDFVDPVVDPQTRTVNVRLNVDNRNERSKPGMFARASLKAGSGAGKRGRLRWSSPLPRRLLPANAPWCTCACRTARTCSRAARWCWARAPEIIISCARAWPRERKWWLTAISRSTAQFRSWPAPA